jgi:hypothetical protein
MQQMIQNAPILTSDGQRSDPDAVKNEIMKQYGVTNQQKLNELIRNASDAGRQQPARIALTEKPAPEPAPGPRPAAGLEPADQCRQIGKVPPSEEDNQRLIAEHNHAGEHLTRAAAISDIENTQPDNTTVRIVGAGVKGPDIIYEHCGQLMQPTVQVKAVKNQRGFNRGLTTELDHDMSSQVGAIQVPDHTTDAPYWQYRYWNSLRRSFEVIQPPRIRGHPEYCESNRRAARRRQRDRRQRAAQFAKMDASTALSRVPSGTYRLVPAGAEEFAKMDAWIVEMTLISKPYEEPEGGLQKTT